MEISAVRSNFYLLVRKQRNTLKLIIVFALLGLATNCKDDNAVNLPYDNNYIVFGSYFGECVGEPCIEIFKIENGVLYEDTADIYPTTQLYEGKFVQLPQAKYDMVKDIITKVPKQLLSDTNTVFGTPDEHDQGGLYLELKVDGKRRFWMMDTYTNRLPEYLREFSNILKE